MHVLPNCWSQFSSDSIVTRLQAGRPGFDTRQWQRIFLFATAPTPTLEPTHHPTQGVLEGCFPVW